MKNYAILRSKKISSLGCVASSLQHCFRERKTPNADTERTPDNEHRAASSTDEAMGRLRELLPEKRRKDAVLAVEYVMTASPEWWKSASEQQQAAFFSQAQGWLAEKYGKDRIITATIHRDETSPHLSAFVVPLTQDGRLSAKEFIGSKAQMTRDQTTFAAAVRDLGLERGIEGSKATHQRVQAFYGAIREEYGHGVITPELLAPRVLSKGLFTKTVETPDAVSERLTRAMHQKYEKAILGASEARQARERAKAANALASDLQKRLRPVIDALAPLNREMQTKALAVIKVLGEKLLGEQREAQRQKLADRQRTRPDRGHDRGR